MIQLMLLIIGYARLKKKIKKRERERKSTQHVSIVCLHQKEWAVII